MAAPAKKQKPSSVSSRSILEFFGAQSENDVDHEDNNTDVDQSADNNVVEIDDSRDETTDTDRVGNDGGSLSRVRKRKYLFQNEWKTTRPWLTLNEKGEMICNWCSQTGKSNTFTEGTVNFRTSTLDRHVEVAGHQQAIQDIKLGEGMKIATSSAFQKRSEAIIRAMEVVYWLAKENVASLKFGSLLDFLDFQGIDVSNMNSGQNATYTSRTSVDEYQESIADVIEEGVMKKVRASPYISLLTDESTDISNTKKMVIYARILDPVTFIASTHFIGNITVEGSSCTAEVLFEHIIKFLNEKNIPITKLIGFGSDGAAVMIGTKTGVSTRLREISPHLINLHCMAHRFNLCTSQASKNVDYLKNTFEPVFKDLYYYFSKSANRTAELKEIQKGLEGPTLKIKEVHEIRWLAFYEALYAVYHSWRALVKYFKANKKTKQCTDLLKKLTDYRFVAFIHIMMDIVPHLAQLSMLLQKSDLGIAAVIPAIDAVDSSLKRALSGESYYQRGMKEKLVHGEGILKFNRVILLVHRSTVLKATGDITKAKGEFIKALQEQMTKRFPKDSKTVASCFDVFGLRNLSFLSANEQEEYGQEKLNTLGDHFGCERKTKTTTSAPKLEKDHLMTEWSLAKAVIRREMYPTDKLHELWQLVHQHHGQTFPNLLKLVSIALVMPYQTADCERGFSQQNMTKTASRNRLEGHTLNRLMMIKVEGPSMRDFDFARALVVWKGKKDRRLFHK